jgi:hypothetical protein
MAKDLHAEYSTLKHLLWQASGVAKPARAFKAEVLMLVGTSPMMPVTPQTDCSPSIGRAQATVAAEKMVEILMNYMVKVGI